MASHGKYRPPAILRLGVEYAAQVQGLRMKFLAHTGGFDADPSAMRWSQDDSRALVLGVVSSQGELLASLRALTLEPGEPILQHFDYHGIESMISGRVTILGKAVTAEEFRKGGFMRSLIRCGVAEAIEKNSQTLAATVLENSLLLPLMQSMGMTLTLNPTGWCNYGYYSKGPTWVATLNIRSHGARALEVLEL